jgi:hypothetical protein
MVLPLVMAGWKPFTDLIDTPLSPMDIQSLRKPVIISIVTGEAT